MKLIVRSKPESFCRAKMKFTRQPVEVDVSADTATILMNEPMLVVEEIKEPVFVPAAEDVVEQAALNEAILEKSVTLTPVKQSLVKSKMSSVARGKKK